MSSLADASLADEARARARAGLLELLGLLSMGLLGLSLSGLALALLALLALSLSGLAQALTLAPGPGGEAGSD